MLTPPASPARRTRRLGLALLAGAALLSSCATFTERDLAARVNDAELRQSDLDLLITDATPGAEPGQRVRVDMSTAHNMINSWLLTEILRGELAAAGLEISADDRDAAIAELRATNPAFDLAGAALRDLQIEQTAVINRWSTGLADALSPADVAAAYSAGPEASMVICVSHILTITAEQAAAAQAALDAGRDFGEVAAEFSLDQATAVNGGALPCANTVQFERSYVTEFVEASLGATINVVTEPVATAFGFHLIRLDPYSELRAPEIDAIYLSEGMRFQRAAQAASVYVDPRYGRFDPMAGVIALG